MNITRLTSLNERILTLRKGHRMTQGDLAQRVGVSTAAISQFEKGDSKPSLETLAKLSAVLGEELVVPSTATNRFPFLSTQGYTQVPFIRGDYNKSNWDYSRRNEQLATGWPENELTLGTLFFPSPMLEEGRHILYPILSNAMEPTFTREDILLFSHMDPQEWSSIDKSGDYGRITDNTPVYAVEVWDARSRSVEIGRLTISPEEHKLYCYQDNRSLAYIILLADVRSIWKFRWHLSKSSQNLHQAYVDRIRELEHKLKQVSIIQDLQEEMNIVNRRVDHVFGTFRERLREIIITRPIFGKNLHRVDCNALANDKKVEKLYITEYGPIKDYNEYINNIELIIRSLVRELASEGDGDINERDGIQAD